MEAVSNDQTEDVLAVEISSVVGESSQSSNSGESSKKKVDAYTRQDGCGY